MEFWVIFRGSFLQKQGNTHLRSFQKGFLIWGKRLLAKMFPFLVGRFQVVRRVNDLKKKPTEKGLPLLDSKLLIGIR